MKVAATVPNGHYYVDSDNTITLRVNGGATYNHQLWNWNIDTVVFDYYFRLRSIVYSVERRRVDDHHSIVQS